MSSIVKTNESSRYYWPNGEPCYELPKKSGHGMKSPTITDARNLGLLPSVTTILRVIHKPALQDWLISQAVKAVMKTPRDKDENDESFLERVLVQERVQDAESRLAADRGSAIHKALEDAIQGRLIDPVFKPYVDAVFSIMESMGKVVWSEKVLVGEGYAGRTDVGLQTDLHTCVIDFKTVGKASLPNESYHEHKLQLAAYAQPVYQETKKHVITGNIYLSTVTPGLINLCLNDNWERDYEAFKNAMALWQYLNDYKP